MAYLNKRLLFVIAATSYFLFINSAQAQTEFMRFDQTDAGSRVAWNDFVHFQSGAFEINSDGSRIINKCMFTNDEWIRVDGKDTQCSIDPKTGEPDISDQAKTEKLPDEPYFLARHFGIDGSPEEKFSDWTNRVQDSAYYDSFYGNIADGLSMEVNNDEFNWEIDTSLLPDTMRNDIPGAGLHVHLGQNFPKSTSELFRSNQDYLQIDLRIKVSKYKLQGNGNTGGVIGVSFHVQNTKGEYEEVKLNIRVVSAEGTFPKSQIASDTRNLYARTGFVKDSPYFSRISGNKISQPTDGFVDISLKIDKINLDSIIADYNVELSKTGQPTLKTNKFTITRIRRISFKNEIGDIQTKNDNVNLKFKIKRFTAKVISPT